MVWVFWAPYQWPFCLQCRCFEPQTSDHSVYGMGVLSPRSVTILFMVQVFWAPDLWPFFLQYGFSEPQTSYHFVYLARVLSPKLVTICLQYGCSEPNTSDHSVYSVDVLSPRPCSDHCGCLDYPLWHIQDQIMHCEKVVLWYVLVIGNGAIRFGKGDVMFPAIVQCLQSQYFQCVNHTRYIW